MFNISIKSYFYSIKHFFTKSTIALETITSLAVSTALTISAAIIPAKLWACGSKGPNSQRISASVESYFHSNGFWMLELVPMQHTLCYKWGLEADYCITVNVSFPFHHSYSGRVVGNGLQAQRQNPEVKVRSPDPILAEVKERLERFTQVRQPGVDNYCYTSWN